MFCYNAREQVGAKVYCDTGTTIAHLGSPKIVTEETYEEHNNIPAIREVYGEYKEKYYEAGGV